MTDSQTADITAGDYVVLVNGDQGDWALLHKSCGPATVLALDGEWPGEPPGLNRPVAWCRFTSRDGHHRYRSADIFDLEKVGITDE